MAALRPGAAPLPVRTPMRTTPSVVALRRSAAARGQIEDEHDGAQPDDDHPENDAGIVVELVATDADDAFEERGAQEKENQRDAHQPGPGADVSGTTGGQPIEDHAQTDRARVHQGPGVGPALIVVGGILKQQDQSRDGDDAPEDGKALADGAARGEGDEEDDETGDDDEERPAIVSDVDMNELTGQQERPDQDEQPANHRRLTASATWWLANGGARGAGGVCWRSLGHAPTLRSPPMPSRAGVRPWPAPWMTGRNRSGHTRGSGASGQGRSGGRER